MDKDLLKKALGLTDEYAKAFGPLLSEYMPYLDELESEEEKILSIKEKSLQFIDKIQELTDECQKTVCTNCMTYNGFCKKDKMMDELKSLVKEI